MAAHRFRTLDGWRGIAALLVALFHFQIDSHIAPLALVRHAWLFVDFFFVLSGFVITYAYAEKLSTAQAFKRFAVRRFARLWPLHAAILAAFVGLEIYRFVATGSGFTGERSVLAIFTNLALIQSFGIHDTLTWNTPAWTISTEFAAYIVFASVCVSTASARMRIVLSVLLVAGSVAILVFFSLYGMRESFDFGIFRCLYGFFIGALTYKIWKRSAIRSGSPLEFAAIILILLFITIPGYRALEYLATPLFAFAVWAFAQEGGVVSRALSSRGANALGRWSYSIYMVHMLVITLIFSALDSLHLNITRFLPDGSETIALNNPFAADAATFVYLVAVVALASLAWRFIEIPGQRLFTRQQPRD